MRQLEDCHSLLIFGGTFDPPHIAHVQLPELAREALQLDVVAYVPAAVSPFKTDRPITPAEHRLAMLELALTEMHHAVIVRDEIDRAAAGEPSYTIDTLRALRRRLGHTMPMRLLIGTDQMIEFHRWKDYEQIIELAEPAVMLRPPDTRHSALAALPAELPAEQWAPRILDLPHLDISASAVREQIRRGEPVCDLVHPDVLDYIQAKGLYGEGMEARRHEGTKG